MTLREKYGYNAREHFCHAKEFSVNALGAFTRKMQGHSDMADVDVSGDFDLEWDEFETMKPFAGTESLRIEDARRNYDEVEEDDDLDDEDFDDEDLDDEDFDEEDEDFDFDEEDEDFEEDDDFELEEDEDFDDDEDEI